MFHNVPFFSENSKVKYPFWRFWMKPFMSSYMCELIDDVFEKLKKGCFRSCLTFWLSKVDSDVLFRSQKLILTFSEIWQIENLKACETNMVNFSLNWNYLTMNENYVYGLYALKSLIFWCLQRQFQNLSLATVSAPWLILELMLLLLMFKSFF